MIGAFSDRRLKTAVAFLGMAATYAACAVAFTVARTRMGAAAFEKGTEDLTLVD